MFQNYSIFVSCFIQLLLVFNVIAQLGLEGILPAKLPATVPLNLGPVPDVVSCDLGKLVLLGDKLVCQKNYLLDDSFKNNKIDENLWTIENYIPFNSPDYEFVSYQNNKANCYVKHNKLYLRPKPFAVEVDVSGELNLTVGCTRQTSSECYSTREGIFILPPVTSARIVSKLGFKYGEIEIKAKLPSGDWIYPQIYLEERKNPKHKLLIAYARGNNRLIGNNDEDIGSRLLYAGPVLEPEEPARSKYLSFKKSIQPFTDDFHVFKTVWKKDSISFLVDNVQFGEVDKSRVYDIKFSDNDNVQLVLGVGVGGINDFPDNYRSGKREKPWKNRDRAQAKKFFDGRASWVDTWDGENSALIVEYVRIKPLE